MPTSAASAIASVAPTRPSRMPPFDDEETSTQRTCPDSTASASHSVVTVVSLPEKPPIAATFAPDWMIAWLAPDWLEMTTVPPPLALA